MQLIESKQLLEKISIGAVQFGMPYGISNQSNKLQTTKEIEKILELAQANHITSIDTAISYKKSEETLGFCQNLKNFNIFTKTSDLSSLEEIKLYFNNSFYESLRKLNKNNIEGLLLHNANNLLQENADLIYSKLLELKQKKLIKKIGISVYNKEQIYNIIKKYKINAVQLPLNLFDHRFIDCLDLLKTKNVEIQLRSIFLQGLIFIEVNKIPNFFNPIKHKIILLHDICHELNLSALDLSLLFAFKTRNIDKILIGVQDLKQLQGIINSTKKVARIFNNSDIEQLKKLSIIEEKFINPSLWQIND